MGWKAKIFAMLFSALAAAEPLRSHQRSAPEPTLLVPATSVPFRPQVLTPPTNPLDFCDDPFLAICGFKDNSESLPLAARMALDRAEERKGNLVDKYASSLPDGEFGKLMESVGKDPTMALQSPWKKLSAYVQEQLPGDAIDFESVRETFLSTIAKSKFWNSSQKVQFTDMISKVRFVTVPDLKDRKMTEAFLRICGPDLMAPEAAADFTVMAVIVCPGFLFSQKEISPSTPTARLINHTVFHELGHFLDPGVKGQDETGRPIFSPFAESYEKFLRCEYQRDEAKLKGTRAYRRYDEFKRDQMSQESIADWWAIEALHQALKSRDASAAESLRTLQDGLRFMCHMPNGPNHPAVSYRIGAEIGSHPGIRKRLGCSTASDIKPCEP